MCIFGALSWEWAEPDITAHEVGGPIERVIPGADNAEVSRIALVIGNGDYGDDPLSNPINDVHMMSNSLGFLGFEAMSYVNVTQQHMVLSPTRNPWPAK